MIEITVDFVIYTLVMLAIGWWAYYKTNSLSDYILGGRKLNPWVAGASAQASDFSGWLLLGLPGAVYVAGLGGIWLGIGQAIGAYLNWQFIAKRLRRYTENAGDAQTLPEFFENRFYDRTHLMRMIGAFFSLIFYTVYVASGMVAGAKLFSAVFGIDYTTGLWLGALIVFIYTLIGGFLAASYTDMIQGFLMFFALIIAPAYIIFSQFGGLGGLWNSLYNINPDLLFITHNVNFDAGSNTPWVSAGSLGVVTSISFLSWGLAYPGQPHIIARFMGIRSTKEIPAARLIAIILVSFCLWGAIFVALTGIAYFKQPLSDPENVFLVMIPKLFNPWVAGFLLAAVLAAIMSTMSSQLVVATSAFANDFYQSLIRKNASPKELLWVGRGTLVVIFIISLTIALSGSKSVLSIVAYAWAGFGSVYGPVVIFSLWWKRTTRNAGLFGMITGGVTVLMWESVPVLSNTGLYSLIPGFFLSCFVIFAVSLCGKSNPELEFEFHKALQN